MKELKVHMMLYMEMKDNETKEEAKERFWNEFTTEKMTTESCIDVYDFGVEEFDDQMEVQIMSDEKLWKIAQEQAMKEYEEEHSNWEEADKYAREDWVFSTYMRLKMKN